MGTNKLCLPGRRDSVWFVADQSVLQQSGCDQPDSRSLEPVQHWMQWYANHLNWPDQWGLYGTTYDYDYSNGVATSRVYADSTELLSCPRF